MDDICIICGGQTLHELRTATGVRTICARCFHGHRREAVDYPYAATAMCGLGTSPERLSSQLSFIAPYLKNDAAILEVGCATGELAALIRSSASISRYEAIELSPTADTAQTAVSRLLREPLSSALSRGTLQPGTFDLVILSHVLEHIADAHAQVEAIRAVLRADGVLFVEVPNGAGNAALPFDDNVSHIHFFSANSLLHLLSAHGFQCRSMESGARLDARYSDCLRIAADQFRIPDATDRLLSRRLDARGVGPVIVWGAASLATELLGNFLDADRILFFVDRDPKKQGTLCLNRPVHSPDKLREQAGCVVLINSVDLEDAIRADLERHLGDAHHRVIAIGELLSSAVAGGG